MGEGGDSDERKLHTQIDCGKRYFQNWRDALDFYRNNQGKAVWVVWTEDLKDTIKPHTFGVNSHSGIYVRERGSQKKSKFYEKRFIERLSKPYPLNKLSFPPRKFRIENIFKEKHGVKKQVQCVQAFAEILPRNRKNQIILAKRVKEAGEDKKWREFVQPDGNG